MQKDKMKCKITQSLIKMLSKENLINILYLSSSKDSLQAETKVQSKMNSSFPKSITLYILKYGILPQDTTYDSLHCNISVKIFVLICKQNI
jgi:hypothetical protein